MAPLKNSPTRTRTVPYSVIFDMDGVLVDNVPEHLKAWEAFCRKHGIPFDEASFKSTVFGKTNQAILRALIRRRLTAAEIETLGAEKEAMYRERHRGRVRAAPGLVGLLRRLRAERVTLAVATAAPRENLDFILDETGLRSCFEALVDVSCVKRGKPDPEIYLKAAALLGSPPGLCIAVEDSFPGIRSALSAGMKVVAVTTTHRRRELAAANLIIKDFRRLTPRQLRDLLSS